MTPPQASLLERYRGIVCDLDGVVYQGPGAIPHAVPALEEARRRGLGIVYATNNGSRPPEDVGVHLSELGLTIGPASVVTSAQAAAARLRRELGADAPVLAIGGPGVPLAIERAGLRVVGAQESADGAEVSGILQSYGPQVAWSDLAEIAYRVNAGALWVASNTDLTIPTARGVAPGNGSLVRVVRAAVQVDPIVVGKPAAPLYELSAEVLGLSPRELLAIGDRVDTDIEGAIAAGIDSLLVLTGISDVAEAASLCRGHRPDFLATDLSELGRSYAEPQVAGDAGRLEATCGDATVRAHEGGVLVSQSGTTNERLRALVWLSWAATDAGAPLREDAVAQAGAGLVGAAS